MSLCKVNAAYAVCGARRVRMQVTFPATKYCHCFLVGTLITHPARDRRLSWSGYVPKRKWHTSKRLAILVTGDTKTYSNFIDVTGQAINIALNTGIAHILWGAGSVHLSVCLSQHGPQQQTSLPAGWRYQSTAAQPVHSSVAVNATLSVYIVARHTCCKTFDTGCLKFDFLDNTIASCFSKSSNFGGKSYNFDQV